MTEASIPASTPNSPIDQLADRYLEQYVALSPTAATFMGIAGHDHELPDYTPSGFEALAELTRRSVAEAQAIEPAVRARRSPRTRSWSGSGWSSSGSRPASRSTS